MAKGDRANLERLLRRAWEMQKRKKLLPISNERTSIPWGDLLLAGLALFIEALAFLYGVSILAFAAGALLWFAIRNYRKERHQAWSTKHGFLWGALLVIVTMLPVASNIYRDHWSIQKETKLPSSQSYDDTPGNSIDPYSVAAETLLPQEAVPQPPETSWLWMGTQMAFQGHQASWVRAPISAFVYFRIVNADSGRW